MAELRPGGMALVIKSHSTENVGKVVRLVEFIGQGEGKYYSSHNDIWLIRCTNSPLKTQLCTINPGETCGCPGKYLIPIDDEDFSHEGDWRRESSHG